MKTANMGVQYVRTVVHIKHWAFSQLNNTRKCSLLALQIFTIFRLHHLTWEKIPGSPRFSVFRTASGGKLWGLGTKLTKLICWGCWGQLVHWINHWNKIFLCVCVCVWIHVCAWTTNEPHLPEKGANLMKTAPAPPYPATTQDTIPC